MLKRNWLLLLTAVATAAFVKADDRILIDAKLNDQPLKLAFDTGASELTIFRRVAEQRGLKVVPPPADARLKPGEVFASRTEPVKLELFGQTSLNMLLGVIDSPPNLPLDTDGQIGWPTIRNNIWFLSGSTSKFTLLKELPPEAAGWIKLRELKDRQILCLELPQKNPGPPVYLGIDTGADSGVRLSAEVWAKWRAAHSEQPVTLEAYFMPGIDLVIAEFAWADEIDIGGLILRNVPVTSMNPIEAVRQPPGTVAVLGLTAMKRMDTVLDGKNGVAYAHPLNTPPLPHVHNRLGAVFVPIDPRSSNDLMAHVAKDSPAAGAGIRDGDMLLKIDELDVTVWRTQPGILPLRRFWVQAPGTKLHLTLLRNGKTLTADVVLRNILGPEPKSP